MTTHQGLERRLRAALIAQRPIEGASAALRVRVLAIPSAARVPWMPFRGVRALMVLIAGATAVAVAAILAAGGPARLPVTSLPDAGAGGVTGFDPDITGMGLTFEPVHSAMILGGLLTLVSAAFAAFTFFSARSGTNRGRAFVLLGLAGVAAGIWLDRFDVGLVGGNVVGVPLGYSVPGPAIVSGPAVYYETAAPGQPTVLVFSLANSSPIAVQIDGVVVPCCGPTVTHWTGVWLPPAGQAQGVPALTDVRPFEPLTLQPGDLSTFYLAGQASPCAVGPSFDPTLPAGTQSTGFEEMGPTLTIAYTVFGFANSAEVNIGMKVVLPSRGGCASFG